VVIAAPDPGTMDRRGPQQSRARSKEARPLSPARDTPRPVDPQLVEYLVVVVPDERSVDGVLDAIETLASGGSAVVLDGAVVAHDRAGAVTSAELPASPGRPSLLALRRGLLSERDLTLIGEAVPSGSLAVVVVVEDEWARPLADAARAAGGHVAGGERIPPARLQSVLRQLHRPGGGDP
jgi:hypothetical protein